MSASKKMDVHFSSKTDQWATPKDFFEKVNSVFGFNLDVCADEKNAKCEQYYSVDDDGLSKKWGGRCWMNPPYGRGSKKDGVAGISEWVKKAYDSSVENDAVVVCLLPARIDTSWFQDFCSKGDVLFLRGRLKFGDAKNSAPFPSALVVFGASGYNHKAELSKILKGFWK